MYIPYLKTCINNNNNNNNNNRFMNLFKYYNPIWLKERKNQIRQNESDEGGAEVIDGLP